MNQLTVLIEFEEGEEVNLSFGQKAFGGSVRGFHVGDKLQECDDLQDRLDKICDIALKDENVRSESEVKETINSSVKG